MSEKQLHHALLRPAVVQILRAQGFSGAKPSVVDTITDIAAKYMILLGTRLSSHAHTNHIDCSPDITDARMALVDCGILQPNMTASEEIWTEMLRKPLDDVPERNDLRRIEIQKRDTEDTEDVEAFVKWFRGATYKEIVRVAGLSLQDEQANDSEYKVEDYITSLKKKHSKTGDDSRFVGTVLGRDAEMRTVKIDGSPGMPESIEEWQERVRHRAKKLAALRPGNGEDRTEQIVEMEDVG